MDIVNLLTDNSGLIINTNYNSINLPCYIAFDSTSALWFESHVCHASWISPMSVWYSRMSVAFKLCESVTFDSNPTHDSWFESQVWLLLSSDSNSPLLWFEVEISQFYTRVIQVHTSFDWFESSRHIDVLIISRITISRMSCDSFSRPAVARRFEFRVCFCDSNFAL